MPPTVTTERRWPWSVNWAMLCRRMCHASSRAWRLRTGVFVLTTSTALVRVTAGLLAQAALVRIRRHNVKLSALLWDISIHKMTSRHGTCIHVIEWILWLVSAVRCGEPPALENTSLYFTSDSYESVAVYSCPTGFVMPKKRKVHTMKCLQNATWVPIPWPCKSECTSKKLSLTNILIKQAHVFVSVHWPVPPSTHSQIQWWALAPNAFSGQVPTNSIVVKLYEQHLGSDAWHSCGVLLCQRRSILWWRANEDSSVSRQWQLVPEIVSVHM